MLMCMRINKKGPIHSDLGHNFPPAIRDRPTKLYTTHEHMYSFSFNAAHSEVMIILLYIIYTTVIV